MIMVIGLVFTLIYTQCTEKKSIYRHIDNPQATYIGMDKCKSCHEDIYKTYMQTGMGQSWDLASPIKSAADFAKAYVYDAKKDLHYHAYWKDNKMYIQEYRILAGDTTYHREEQIKYIVGSGQHTNSHLYEINGYLHQAPITYYTQSKKWDLAPGFENNNTGFNREIEAECITCHNGYPTQVAGSINKYTEVKRGIDCERCHGPGSLHAEAVLAGKIHDTSKSADLNIVNPRRMNTESQNQLCMRCHLQGISVLNDQSTFYDFQPSHALSQHWNVFMPNFTNKNNMIMASHVERMKQSACYIKSNKMSCITCHNPHQSVRFTAKATFNKACINCHQEKKCSEDLVVRNQAEDDCSGCHMKKNEATDIPHVAVHDHWIKKNIHAEENKKTNDEFNGLITYNTDQVSDLIRGRGFLEYYEKFNHLNRCMDSATFYITRDGQQKKYQNKDFIRIAFLKNDMRSITKLASNLQAEEITDHWNAYRIAEAYAQEGEDAIAQPFFERAINLMPYHLDVVNKYAQCLTRLGNVTEAKKQYQFIIQEFPRYAEAHSNLGYLYMKEKKYQQAITSIAQAVMLDPMNVQSRINLAVCYYSLNDKTKIKPILYEALHIDPQNQQVKAMIDDLSKS
jgi:tetratricopeptide (TPR) repeat protein